MILAAVQDFFSDPDKWQNFEYLTSGGASSVFASSIDGFVRRKKVVEDRRCKIQPGNFYLTYDYKTTPCTPYYEEAENMFIRGVLRIAEDGKVIDTAKEIHQSNALDKDGNLIDIGKYVIRITEEPMLDVRGNKIPKENPSLGTLELDTALEVVRWKDKTSGIIHTIAIDQIAMLAIKPIEGNPNYPGQGTIY